MNELLFQLIFKLFIEMGSCKRWGESDLRNELTVDLNQSARTGGAKRSNKGRFTFNYLKEKALQQLRNRFAVGQDRDGTTGVIVVGLVRIDAELLINRCQ
ncbi:hypothetical protein V6x_17930 [Gimesia chilikensis]|uniref:Uncharacterized protein n=1 Tax=Gimesia chilikensis TaxID=2605989 RepID=A0A517WA12_9PLAN|nr:hypothetical protein V6x_17930 [Gimesia chilikensis]